MATEWAPGRSRPGSVRFEVERCRSVSSGRRIRARVADGEEGILEDICRTGGVAGLVVASSATVGPSAAVRSADMPAGSAGRASFLGSSATRSAPSTIFGESALLVVLEAENARGI